MVYKVIGLMSGSSLDGLDIAYVHLQERAATSQLPKTWDFSLLHTACYPYPDEWRQRLASATALSALDYQVLDVEYGHYLGEQVLRFIEEFGLHYQVQLIVSHGHTTFHWPARRLTAQQLVASHQQRARLERVARVVLDPRVWRRRVWDRVPAR